MPFFTFYNTIPGANNDPSTDQPKMLTNNQSTNSIIGVDHFTFNDNAGGLHKQVTLPLRGGGSGSIPPGIIAGEGAVYTKTDPSFSETELFYTPDATGTEYQLTPCFPVRMAVNFDGLGSAGPVPVGNIRASFNVASITKNGTGDYTITFTNPTPTANYFIQAIGMRGSSDDISNVQLRGTGTYTNSCSTTFVRLQTNGGTSGLESVRMLSVIIFGG